MGDWRWFRRIGSKVWHMRVVGENYALCGFLASGRQVEKEPEPVCKWCAKKAVKEVKGG